jgi:hypothetical protein
VDLLTLNAVLILALTEESALEHGNLSSVTVRHRLLVPRAKKVSNNDIKSALHSLQFLHHTDSQTATFFGNNYISYRIRNPNIVRTLRQTDPSIYRTAQNIISFSLAMKVDSGTVLQLGDPVAGTDYALLEVGIQFS